MVDISSLQHKDIATRQSRLGDLQTSLQTNSVSLGELSTEDKYRLIEVLIENVKNSNPRISHPSLECLQALSESCLNVEFKQMNKNIIAVCREKLSDTHENVRQSSCNVIITMMSPTIGLGPQDVFQLLADPILSHKSPKVREEGLKLFRTTMNMYPTEFKIARYLQQLFILLTDSTAPVRAAATDLLVLIYQRHGQRIKTELSNSKIPPDKKKKLLKDFEDADFAPKLEHISNPSITESESSTQEEFSPLKPVTSIEGSQPTLTLDLVSNSSIDSDNGSSKSMPIMSKLPINQKRTGGGLSVDDFERAFSEVKTVYISSEAELEKQISKLRTALSCDSEEWELRISLMKELQSIVRSCIKFPTLSQHIRKFDSHLNDCLKDLRSQVAREACITVAFISKMIGKVMEKSFEYLAVALLTVIQNSAKIINSSADICLQYCLLNTQTGKVLPQICRYMESKSAIVKKRCAEYINIIMLNWSVLLLKPHETSLMEALRRGLIDGDPDCRLFSRKAFPSYNRYFPISGAKLLSSLNPALQKTLRELTPELESSPLATLLAPRSSIPKNVSRGQGLGLGLRSAVSESNIRDSEPMKVPTKTPPPHGEPLNRLKLDVRSQTVSGRTKGIRPSLGGMCRSSSALAMDREEDSLPALPSSLTRGQTGSMRVKKSSGGNTPGDNTPRGLRKTPNTSQSLMIRSKLRTKDSNPETTLTSVEKKKTPENTGSMRSQSADLLNSRNKNSQRSISPEPLPLEMLSLPEFVKQIKKPQFAEKKAGIEGLQQLINSVQCTMSMEEVAVFKDTLKWLFAESHSKLYVQFLDMLMDFIKVYKSYAEDWGLFLLMKLIHRLGTETMTPVKDKIRKVLDLILLDFDKRLIFNHLWRILTDTTQPLGPKGKQMLFDYLREVTNHSDTSSFAVSASSLRGFEVLVRAAQDTNKPELCRSGRATLQALFSLNCATYSSLSDNMATSDRELLTSLMRIECESPTGEQRFSPGSDVALGKLLKGYSTDQDRRVSDPTVAPSRLRLPEPDLPRDPTRRICVTPVLGHKKYDSQKSPRGGTAKFTRHIPVTMSLTDTRFKLGGTRSEPGSPTDDTALPMFSLPVNSAQIQDMINKDTNFEHEEIEESPTSNSIQSAIKEYNMCCGIEEKVSNLILLLTIIQTSFDDTWVTHLDVLLNIAMDAISQFDYATITITSLRIIRELLKRKLTLIMPYTKKIVQFLVDTYPNPKSDISRSCEEIMNHLSGNLDANVVFEMLAPTIAIDQHESLMSAIGKHKILHKTIPDTSPAILNAHLATFCPVLIQNYKHSDPTVRKASCFVLVALYSKLGMSVYEYFHELSPAQMKLLTLYMTRRADEKDEIK